MKRFAMAAMLTAFGWAGLAHAAPLDPATVSSDAKWLIHVDFDAAHESGIIKHLHDTVMKDDHVKEAVKKFEDATGMDPHKDLHGITLYGTNFKMHSGVLIVYANADHEKAKALVKEHHDDMKETKVEGAETWTWTEHHGKHEQTVYVAFPKKGTAVVAGNEDDLKGALATLGGKDGLSSGSRLLGDTPKGTIYQVAVIGLDKAELPVKLPLLQKISRLRVVAGDNDGEAFKHGRVSTTDAETAEDLSKMAEGLRAVIDLHLGDKMADIKKMIDAAKISAADSTLKVDWTGSDEQVNKALDQIISEIKEHHKKFEDLHQRGQKKDDHPDHKGPEKDNY